MSNKTQRRATNFVLERIGFFEAANVLTVDAVFQELPKERLLALTRVCSFLKQQDAQAPQTLQYAAIAVQEIHIDVRALEKQLDVAANTIAQWAAAPVETTPSAKSEMWVKKISQFLAEEIRKSESIKPAPSRERRTLHASLKHRRRNALV